MKRGVSVVEVAESIGVSIASIYLWETDRGRALCKVLKLPVRATRELVAG
jgi:hypothetical protein